jgi:hypothetical protein
MLWQNMDNGGQTKPGAVIKVSAEGQLVRCDQPVAHIEEAFKASRGAIS